MRKNIFLLLFPLFVGHGLAQTNFLQQPKTTRYDLYVRDTIVEYAGKPKHAYAVNGQIPMPELHFTEGDTAEIHIHNELKTATSIQKCQHCRHSCCCSCLRLVLLLWSSHHWASSRCD